MLNHLKIHWLRKAIRVLCLIFLFIGSDSSAQVTNIGRAYVPPSPQAASFGIYAVTPVDFYTGVPDIHIPLYDIKIKGFEMNINLSYHAGGIRANAEASNVGLNWALNAGGVITRTVRHKDDLGTNGFYKVNPASRPCDDNNDQEPDIFFYNFCGKTGKFFIDYFSAGVYIIRQAPKTSMFIYLDGGNNFKIMDENGVTYWFEQKENNNSYSSSPGNTFNENYSSAWYLTRVISPYGEQITLTYTYTGNRFQNITHRFSKRSYSSASPANIWSTGTTIGGMSGISYYQNFIVPYLTTYFNQDTYSNTDELVPATITFPGGAIKFYSSTRTDCRMSAAVSGMKIDRMDVLKNSVTGAPLKSWNFGYDYYSSGSGQPDKISKRLRLISVQETDGVQTLPAHTFIYSSSVLPDKADNVSAGEGFLGINGLLTQINYPTGGYSAYTYEPHFNNLGARILTSLQNDSKGDINKRSYEYTGGKALGQYTDFGGIIESSPITYQLFGVQGDFTGSVFWSTTFGTTLGALGETSSNYAVGYDKVTEYIGDNGAGGKTEIDFNNIANPVLADGVPQEIATVNGFPTAKSIFAKKAGSYVLLEKHTYSYGVNNHTAVSVKRRFLDACNKTYNVVSDWIALNNEEEFYYDKDGANPVRNYRSYTYGSYPYHLQPTQIMETDSKGLPLKTVNAYAWEKSSVATVYSQMTSKNLWGTLIEQTKFLNNVQIEKTTTSFKDWFGDQKIIAPWVITKQKGALTSRDELTFKQYDVNGNPTEVTKEDGITTAYIWDYSKNYMIAECRNAKAADIAYSGFESDGLGGWSMNTGSSIVSTQNSTGRRYFSGTLSKSSLAANTYVVTLWGYKLGTQTVNGTAGQTLYTMGTWALKRWELVNPGTVTVVADLCDDVRLHPKAAEMSTWTYDNLVGVTAMADSRNKITFYEYDGMNRLAVIRDQDRNVVKRFCYNYNGQVENCTLTYSDQASGVYTRNNCGALLPSQVTYIVPAGSYLSTLNLSDANWQANNDVWANGQDYANKNGTCTTGVTVYGYNTKTQPYNLIMNNTATGTSYAFVLNANSTSTILGAVPAGTYNITFYPRGMTLTCTFGFNGFTMTGTGASFSNVNCNTQANASIN